MDDQIQTPDTEPQLDSTQTEPTDVPNEAVEQASSKYLSTWNHLVSTTNWEKGRIIQEWRESLREVDAAASDYSDEAWSRRVGNVTPQHVGRLRRVYDRFHETQGQYEGLFWSHFQAALDWDDAEMWLEGAVQSKWSVSVMRQNRWEAVGAPADQKPRDEDIILAELDEDVSRADDSSTVVATEDHAVVQDFDDQLRDEDTSIEAESLSSAEAPVSEAPSEPADLRAEPIRPFEDLPSLPADLHEAVETMKLAIINHKMAGWKDVSCDDVLAVLSALKQLAMAPSDD